MKPRGSIYFLHTENCTKFLSYYLPFNSGANLTFRVGYMFAAYVNGINQVFPTSLVPEAFNNGVIAIQTSSQQTSDLDLNGPYASVTWKF